MILFYVLFIITNISIYNIFVILFYYFPPPFLIYLFIYHIFFYIFLEKKNIINTKSINNKHENVGECFIKVGSKDGIYLLYFLFNQLKLIKYIKVKLNN